MVSLVKFDVEHVKLSGYEFGRKLTFQFVKTMHLVLPSPEAQPAPRVHSSTWVASRNCSMDFMLKFCNKLGDFYYFSTVNIFFGGYVLPTSLSFKNDINVG